MILSIGGRTPENPRHAPHPRVAPAPREVKLEVLRQRKRLTLDVQMPDVDPMSPGFRPVRPACARPTAPPAPPADPKAGGISSLDSG